MPRKREGIINESVAELTRIEEEYRGKPEVFRISALRLLKERPESHIDDIAAILGYSPAAVKRWLRTYRDGGLQALLEKPAKGKAQKASNQGLSRLKQALILGEITSLDEVESWIRDHRRRLGVDQQVSYVASGVPLGGALPQPEPITPAGADTAAGRLQMAERWVMCYLREFSNSRSPNDWSVLLRETMVATFPDIDAVTVVVNMFAFRPDTDEHGVTFAQVNQKLLPDADKDDTLRVVIDGNLNKRSRVERTLGQMRRTNFPFDQYHPPKVLIYQFEDGGYVGQLLLWRERHRAPISEETLSAIMQMENVILFLLSDMAARQAAADPPSMLLNDITEGLTREYQLGRQESRILSLQMVGHTYEEMARTLNISINTVRTHVRSLYAKLGTHGPADFVAKYFTLRRIDIMDSRTQE